MSHAHISVFYGPKADFSSGLVIHRTTSGWNVVDHTGELGAPGAVLASFATDTEACRDALRRLRSRLKEPVVPCWGGGADSALKSLGYTRGQLRWRWWPLGFVRMGESLVGADGLPVGHR